MLLALTRWLAGVAALPCLLLSAQSAPAPTQAPRDAAAEVAVRAVRFDRVREAGGWLEAGVHLAVTPGPGGERQADRVRVTLLLAYETDRQRDDTLRCYQSEAEVITMPVGNFVVRFYLPPEVVERDRVRTEGLHWVVDVHQQGRPLPVGAGALSASLRSPDRLVRFRERVAREAPVNAGVLVPQYLSPFADDPRRPTPSCVR